MEFRELLCTGVGSVVVLVGEVKHGVLPVVIWEVR